MAKNPVQFQKGLSLTDFMQMYGTEEKCRQAIANAKWRSGYHCPQCGGTQYCVLSQRGLYQCNHCRHQTSITAGTIFHGTRLALPKWFLAMYLITQRKKGVSAMELGREIGVSYNTAWAIKHKLMQVMHERQKTKKLSGRIEMDDAYLGGEKAGKRGRGSTNKQPFVACVQTTSDGKPEFIHLRRVKGFRLVAIGNYAKQSLEAGSTVVSDGLNCFRAVTNAGCIHQPNVVGSGRNSTSMSCFKWVNTVLGNLKNGLRGTYHAVRSKHAQRYLSEFEYRFNRRFDLPAMIPRLVHAAVLTPPMPYRYLKMAERSG